MEAYCPFCAGQFETQEMLEKHKQEKHGPNEENKNNAGIQMTSNHGSAGEDEFMLVMGILLVALAAVVGIVFVLGE